LKYKLILKGELFKKYTDKRSKTIYMDIYDQVRVLHGAGACTPPPFPFAYQGKAPIPAPIGSSFVGFPLGWVILPFLKRG
jgi:hypothetical protein